jgi:uncharacterized protein YjbI with pentapeptide repeats
MSIRKLVSGIDGRTFGSVLLALNSNASGTDPAVIAALIAAGASLLTLLGSMAMQAAGIRRVSRDTTHTVREQLGAQREQLDRTLAEERLRTLNERFATAADRLGSDTPAPVRLAAVYAMVGLADDWPENRQTCVDVLCAYLRMPYSPDPGDDAPEAQRLSFQEDREVRHTVIRVIGDHLREGAKSWCGLNLDFTGVRFDDGDFARAEFSGGRVSFARAVFSGGEVSFTGAVFSGGEVSFTGAVFSGGEVSFTGAVFSGGRVLFEDAVFSGGSVLFEDAVFSGGRVSFRSAKFSGGKADFISAKFSGGKASFIDAVFSGGRVSFYRAEFSGSEVDFAGAKFSGAWVGFPGAVFSGGEVEFVFAVFSGGSVQFVAAVFHGGSVSFCRALFSGGRVSFKGALFSGGTVDFGARFSDGTVTLTDTPIRVHPPTFDFARSSPPAGVLLPPTAAAHLAAD